MKLKNGKNLKKIIRKFRVPRKQGAHFSGAGLKFKILGLFHHQHEISDRQSTIMPNIWNLGLWPDYGVGHMCS
jgi:hypothetical protein